MNDSKRVLAEVDGKRIRPGDTVRFPAVIRVGGMPDPSRAGW